MIDTPTEFCKSFAWKSSSLMDRIACKREKEAQPLDQIVVGVDVRNPEERLVSLQPQSLVIRDVSSMQIRTRQRVDDRRGSV